MKKRLLIANVILVYLIPVLLVLLFASDYFADIFGEDISLVILLIWPIYSLIIFVVNVIACIKMWRGSGSTEKIIKSYFLIKVMQAPAYAIIFILGVLFMITIFTIGVSIVFMIMDAISVVISAMLGLAVFHRMKKDGMINEGTQILMSAGSFFFCVDVGVSIFAYIMSKNNVNKAGLEWKNQYE